MKTGFTRRALLQNAAALGAATIMPSIARAEGGILAKMRADGVARIAVPQTPPWSEIKPDGSLAGIAPEIVIAVMKELGVPNIEALPTTYAELIPGMMAGRWDFIGACLSISQQRCKAVRFSDPICFGYLCVAYRSDEISTPPTSLADAAASGLKIATNSGGYQLPMLRKLASDQNILLFDNSAATVEAVVNKRADIAIDSYYGFKIVKVPDNIAYTPALTDTGYDESGPAFRLQDADLADAFNEQLAKLRTSGFVAQINAKYGYEYSEEFNKIDAAFACSNANT